LKSTPLGERSATITSENLQASQDSNTFVNGQLKATGKSDQTGETQEFKELVKELNEGKYEPSLLSRFFTWLTAVFQ
jgi:hypothetical protein